MDKKNNKNIWIVVGIIVLVLIIVYAMRASAPMTVPTGESAVTTTTPVDETEDVSTGSVDTSAAVTLSYQQALIKYAKARIQLDDQCQAIPNVVTYKNGTNIMLDNRAAATRNIHLGSYFTIKGYGFKIVNLSSSTLPAKLLLDCGTSQANDQNVATITIQK